MMLPQMDRRTYRLVRLIVFPIEHPFIFWLAVLAINIAIFASLARASCNTIPERMNALCNELGFSGACEFTIAPTMPRMTLVLTTTDNAHEPLHAGTSYHATAVSLLTRHSAASEVYQRADAPTIAPQIGADAYMNPTLSGLNESDVTCERVLEKLLWQSDVREMGDQLRTLYGETGWPFIARTYDHTCTLRHDGTADDSSTTLTVDVRIGFAEAR